MDDYQLKYLKYKIVFLRIKKIIPLLYTILRHRNFLYKIIYKNQDIKLYFDFYVWLSDHCSLSSCNDQMLLPFFVDFSTIATYQILSTFFLFFFATKILLASTTTSSNHSYTHWFLECSNQLHISSIL